MRAADLGAAIIHLHARGSDEEPVPDPEVYAEIIGRIRDKRPDIILCATTSGRNYNELEKRATVLGLVGDLRPDMASLTLGSMNFTAQASVNAPQTIRALAGMMLERGIKPELEVFEMGMVDYSKYLYRNGLLRPPFYYNVLLGSLGTMSATKRHLDILVEELPVCSVWAATGVGASQYRVQCWAMESSGGVRTGLEDNLFLDDEKRVPASNEDLLRRILGKADELHREIASPAEVRAWLEL